MNNKIDALFTHKSDDWATPSDIYSIFMQKGFLDPCKYKSDVNGFGYIYDSKRIYINPPFSANKYWVKYAVDLALCGNDVWLLIACRTDTNYFRYIYENMRFTMFFITGRISFNDKGHAPFPVVFIHLNTQICVNSFLVGTSEEFIYHIESLY